jgi:hypothetical protein
MDSFSESPGSEAPLKKKLKIGNGNACELCRSKKVKCDGMRPGMLPSVPNQLSAQIPTLAQPAVIAKKENISVFIKPMRLP